MSVHLQYAVYAIDMEIDTEYQIFVIREDVENLYKKAISFGRMQGCAF
jgi:hypothetical protein